jgi:uncharacterized protein (TIGR02246 family)
MTRFSVVAFSLLLLLSLTGCTQTPPAAQAQPDTRAADEKAVSDFDAAWLADWQSKDVEKIVARYADDAVVMEPGMPAMKGKDAIRAGVAAFLNDKNFALTWTTTKIETSKGGDLAYSQVTFKATLTDPTSHKPVTEIGKGASIYRKQADGTWKVILDINNSDAPAK